MTRTLDHIDGQTFHSRKGAKKNAFRYAIDYVIFDAEHDARGPGLFSRNGKNLTGIRDIDHGGPVGEGRGAAWVRDVLRDHQLPQSDRILLLAQPRILGHVFNPVSFWLCYLGEDLTVVISEVTNTFGERHSYLCHHSDLSPITAGDRLMATKIFYVSPFQPVEGGYEFRFDIRADRIGISIDYTQGEGGLIATLTGRRAPLTNRAILNSLLRRPFGSRRVLALIHWQAVKLWWKGARYRLRGQPPDQEVTRG